MRRSGTRIGIIAVILLAFVVTGFVAYGRGKTAGQTAASSDRSFFGQARGTSVAGGQGRAGGGFGGSGQQSGGGGSPSAGGQSVGGPASAVVGKVTKVDNGTLTLQEQTGNTTSTVATDASTSVTTFAPGALSDLAMGDIVAVQGDKTGDTAYTAKTIYALNGAQNGGRAGRAQGGADTTAGTAAAGSPASGGRGRNATGAAGSAPSGRGAGLPGLTGPTGRISQISGGTLTLQGFDGSTTTVTTNASTSVRKETPGMVSDIKAGDTVAVQSDPTGDATAPARAIMDLGAGT